MARGLLPTSFYWLTFRQADNAEFVGIGRGLAAARRRFAFAAGRFGDILHYDQALLGNAGRVVIE